MRKLLAISFVAVFTSNSFAYYQAEQGRWMSKDPVGEAGGINLSAFYYNNIIGYTDPLGLNVYGVDGTWFNANGNDADKLVSNTYDFTQKTIELQQYYGGPGGASKGAMKKYRGATGAEISRIIRDVHKQVCTDYCNSNGKITVNLVGWSRGERPHLQWLIV